jgi:membrane associated rhomboid family serine protease
MTDSQEMGRNRPGLQEAQINRALGLFLLFFACVVLVSIFFTPTLVGKLTNLAAGAIIGLIAVAMIYRSRKRIS